MLGRGRQNVMRPAIAGGIFGITAIMIWALVTP